MNFDINTAIFITFLAGNLIFGLWASRGVNTFRSYAIGDRNFSTVSIVATIVATWIGGGFFSIAVSQTYQDGIWFIAAGSADIIAMLIIGYILAPRMASFLGKVSVAETMGDLYGNNIRIITSISSILISVGAISMQVKVLSTMFNYFFHFSGTYAVLISSAIIIFYSAFGGIKAVTFTDILQFLTFGTFIPTFTLFIWESFGNYSIMDMLQSPLFDYSELANYHNPKFFPYLSLFIYGAIPALDPAIFQRLLIAKNIGQIRQSFIIAALVGLCIFIVSCLLGAIMHFHNANLDPNNLLMYILDNYAYTGLKGIVLVGITAMIMSTADSYINVASVTFANDLCKPMGIENKSNELFIPRFFAFIVGCLAVLLALFNNNMLELLLLIGNFYSPVIMVPLIMAILGFRTSTRVVLLAIASGIATVIIWRIWIQESTNVDSVLPGTIANFITLVCAHYLLNEKTIIKHQSSIDLKNYLPKRNTNIVFYILEKIRTFDFIEHCAKQAPKQNLTYIYAGFSILSAILVTISLDKVEYKIHLHVINLLQGAILFISSSLIFHSLWFKKLNNKSIGLIWYCFIFIGLAFFSSFLVLIGKFSQLSLVIFILHLTIIGLLMNWQTTIIMSITGIILALVSYRLYINNRPDLVLQLPEFKSKIVYMLFMISSLWLTFIKSKQEYIEATEHKVDDLELEVGELEHENVYLGQEVSSLNVKVTDLDEKVVHYNQRINDQALEIERLGATAQKILNNVNHELRLPVGNVVNFAEMLSEGLGKYTKKQLKELSDEVFKNSTRLSTMILNMLDLAMLDVKKIELVKKTINLSELVEDRIEQCRKIYVQGKDLEFELNLEPEIMVYVDSNYIRQTVDNLVINAITYSKSGTIRISLLLKAKNIVELIVQDEGIGIPRSELYDIFTPFKMGAHTESKAEGRGVGLALCKAAIEAHEGQITVDSKGRGAIFTVVLSLS